MNYRSIIYIVLISQLTLLITGCSSRLDSPEINNEEGTVIYSPKDRTGIIADILLYKGMDVTTGLPLAAGSFMLAEDAKIYAEVKLSNLNYHSAENLMLHLDWIDREGNSFFKKRVDIPPGDTLTELKSAISIPPGKRDTGDYKFRVYLFRELIAEKNFLLTSYNVDSANIFSDANSGKISAEISTGSKYDTKKDTPADTGSIFTIGNKARIYAGIQLLNENLYRGKELLLDIAWTYSNDSSFFNKTIHFSPYDKLSTLSSSISISDKSRDPGKYKLKVYLYGNLIKEKSFSIVKQKEQKAKLRSIKGVRASIICCTRFNKKTGSIRGESDSFVLKRKARVYAVVRLKDIREKKDKNPEIKIEWLGPGNETFYHKTFSGNKKNIPTILSSSISISPDKRSPGGYKCRVFYNSELISEKTFMVTSSPL